jgi:hypothetical protein
LFGLAGQTTTPTPATTSTPNTPGAYAVQALLIGARGGRSELGFRVVEAEVQAEESLTATLKLTRHGKPLANSSIPGIRAGNRVLTVPIPGSVARGEATLTITLTDGAGNHHAWTRAINVPK